MDRLECLLGALNPKRWPVRWRLAAVSASLTLVILVAFVLVVGLLVDNRLESNFNNELHDQANRVALEFQANGDVVSPDLKKLAFTGTAAIKVVFPDGTVYRNTEGEAFETPGVPFGPPDIGHIRDIGAMRVATVRMGAPSIGSIPPLFLQYARDTG